MFENPYIVLGVPEDATSYEIKKTVDRLLSSFKDNDKILVDGKYYTEKMIKDAAIMLLNDELRPQVDLKLKHDRQNEDMIKYNLQKARFTSDDVVVSNIDNDYMNVEIVFNRDFLKGKLFDKKVNYFKIYALIDNESFHFVYKKSIFIKDCLYYKVYDVFNNKYLGKYLVDDSRVTGNYDTLMSDDESIIKIVNGSSFIPTDLIDSKSNVSLYDLKKVLLAIRQYVKDNPNTLNDKLSEEKVFTK